MTGLLGSRTNFSRSRLDNCDLSGSEWCHADFSSATLQMARVVSSDLTGADFSEATLGGSDFSGSSLRAVQMSGANLFGANFCGADLTGARDLTQQQLLQARTDHSTILPNGSRGPYIRFSGAEKPKSGRNTGWM
jgi:serine/threonine-protein kinase